MTSSLFLFLEETDGQGMQQAMRLRLMYKRCSCGHMEGRDFLKGLWLYRSITFNCEFESVDWINQAQDRENWLNTVTNLWNPQDAGNLSGWRIVRLSGRTLLHAVRWFWKHSGHPKSFRLTYNGYWVFPGSTVLGRGVDPPSSAEFNEMSYTCTSIPLGLLQGATFFTQNHFACREEPT